MSTVVDLGCHDHGKWNSLSILNELFQPDLIYGFDPSPQLDTTISEIEGTPVVLERKAAWIENGEVPFQDGDFRVPALLAHDGNATTVGRVGGITKRGDMLVPAFDFAEWLSEHGPCAVKMDVEGAEYQLLARLIATGAHTKMTYLLVEWHDWVSEELIRRLECPVVRWWL